MGVQGEKHTVHCEMCSQRKPRSGGIWPFGRDSDCFVCGGCKGAFADATRAAQMNIIKLAAMHGPTDTRT